MIPVKKFVFALIFLILTAEMFYFADLLFKTTDLIFSLNLEALYQLLILSLLILASALVFTIFAALALNWKLVLPIIIVSSGVPFFLISFPLSLALGVGIMASLILSYLGLEGKMRSYLTFQPSSLLSPAVKQLAGLLILTLSVSFYLSATKQIARKDFEVPDSLIDSVLKAMPLPNLPVQGFKQIAQLPQVTPEQLELLKKNPDLVRQYGIDPKTLDSLNTLPAKPSSQASPSQLNPTTEMIKPLVKQQLQSIIKPYQNIIPAVLALLLFLTLQSLVSVLGIFLSPLLLLIFYILEKTKFIHFETETREVKKLVV